MLLVDKLEGPDRALDFERLLPTPPELLDEGRPVPAGRSPDWYTWRRAHPGSNGTHVR